MTGKMQEHLANVKLKRVHNRHRTFNWWHRYRRHMERRLGRRFKLHIRSQEIFPVEEA